MESKGGVHSMRNILLTILLASTICSTAYAGYTVSSGNLLVPSGNVGVGSATPRAKVDVDGSVYATAYYGSGASLTDLPASMTYPTGDGVAVVSGGTSWGTTLSTDGSGACSSGAVCLGDHTHASLSADLALGTSTSGNYVNDATETGGLTMTGTEGATLGLTPCTGNENYIMKWNAATGWTCQADAAAASGLATTDIDTSSELAGILTDETGSGSIVFSISPAFTTPNIGSATGSVSGNAGTASALAADPANCASSGLAGGVTAAGVAEGCYTVNGTGTVVALITSPTFVTPALGTPASGVVTNLTGTAANVTVGTATLAGTVTTAAQTNITSLGTLTGLTVNGAVGLGTTTLPTNNLLVTAGNVGIGSATPAHRLDVAGSGQFVGTGDSIFGGNVGIGTTAATKALMVGSTGQFSVDATGIIVDTTLYATTAGSGGNRTVCVSADGKVFSSATACP